MADPLKEAPKAGASLLGGERPIAMLGEPLRAYARSGVGSMGEP